MNSSSDNLEILYQNIDKYFAQEYQNYVSEINYVVSSLERMTLFATRFDVYSTIILIEKVRVATSLVSCPKLVSCSTNIKNHIINIYVADCTLTLQLLKRLKVELKYYQELLKDYFEELIITARNKNCHDFAKYILSRKKSFNSYDVAQVRIVKLASKFHSEQNLNHFLEAFSCLMTRVKTFAKNSCSVKQYFPLKDNPIAELVQLVVSKKTESYQIDYKTISDSEALYLKAYQQVHSEDEKLFFSTVSKSSLVINKLSLEYQDNGAVKQKLDYSMFVATQYFLDFDIKSNILSLDDQLQEIDRSSFNAFINRLAMTSKALPDIKHIHQQLGKQATPFTDVFGKNEETVYFAEELSALINFYFHKNVASASYINYLLYSKKTSQLNSVFEFEQVLIDTVKSLKIANQSSYAANIEKLMQCMKKLDEIYIDLQAEEDVFSKKRDFIYRLQTIASNFQLKNYKDLMVEHAKESKAIDSKQVLKKINKYIDAGSYDNATSSARELTHSLLIAKYYTQAKLYNLYEIPPLSAKIHQELSGIDFSDQQTIFGRINGIYEEYWRV
ncbi:hypothetical protein [Francisella adeliensis]|uniref:Uncharacterized protein n=1 Tax=Francisella adeliensis TaxID=2007306 RepID=A0A2Z4XX65_9GAMM|nr:hypothetical protein [Francisella adeliensis]AXA32995.1 hypothetical protein CDH04_00555 [Francisella adeliensis]MBK2086120.1 hypothetical protein [Francisella adeliensis]MBK2096716.1 hypothetical protein [Francisella adeliensis]QIW11221.1 hypothetical protein FZC43_00555 [Francisella adeliensis]QIW13097.1 hypothetical protein FZC44_00555 [Francisella adeliensis]